MESPVVARTAPDSRPALLFDQQDLDLVELINEFGAGPSARNAERLRKLFNISLHPRGLKELSATRQQRIAYAVIELLASLDTGMAQDRLLALKALKDELFEGGDQTLLRNTGRVLLATMKQLVRHRQDYWAQVAMAHEFFAAVSGRPLVIRQCLRKHHLVEMAETWNQVAFDHHVHDAHTKGRKAPTHLVVDAWIKGIREMTVIYYYVATTEAITELLEAAEVMGMVVRPGIEVAARLRGRYAQIIWVPRGLHNPREYVDFLAKPQPSAFLDEGREVIQYNTANVLQILESFNSNHLTHLNAEYGLEAPRLSSKDFLEFVGVGQPSRTHLAEYIYGRVRERIDLAMIGMRESWHRGAENERRTLETRAAQLGRLTQEHLAQTYLSTSANPSVHDIHVPEDGPGVPRLLTRPVSEVVGRLHEIRAGAFLTLNPSNLTPADVLEAIYDCQGAITHLEVFNLKDYQRGLSPHVQAIAQIRRVLNTGNPITCKKMIREIIRDVEQSDEAAPAKEVRLAKLREILGNMMGLLAHYEKDPMGSRMGSDSTGRARSWSGMGLAVASTLLPRARREFRKNPGSRQMIPIHTDTVLRTTWRPLRSDIGVLDAALRFLRRLPVMGELGFTREESYEVVPNTTRMSERGNIVTLGGTPETSAPLPSITATRRSSDRPGLSWQNLNSNAKNILKVLIGFLPAFATFFLTKDWWVLAYLGAPIWFGITGLRNIIQAVVGGGGIVRSNLLRWRDLVSWGRVADSLLYTGFSVPLLDWLVKSVLLQQGLGITTATAPVLLYSVLAIANGTYLFSHNAFRGLPRGVAFGNFFRSVLSIPIAIALNALGLYVLQALGLEEAAALAALQSWAAVIGKLASDTVAGVIEGTADRSLNIGRRRRDYAVKLARLMEVHGRLEAMFPQIDVVERLASPKEFFRTLGKEAIDLETQQIINALDLMYFWMYQPRARAVFEEQLAAATPEERRIILRTQRLLERKRPISEMFLNDLAGKNFSPPLAFYLAKSTSYLRDMQALAAKCGADWSGSEQGQETPSAVA